MANLRTLDTSKVSGKTHQSGLFSGTKAPKSLTKYNLYRGITDFGTLEQFNIYESGRSYLKILQYPEFLRVLGNQNAEYKSIIDNALHVIEFEFKGLDGFDDITATPVEISDGVNGINVINKVEEQSTASLTSTYVEKSGSLLTKFTELYLQGIYDTRSTFKHYHGAIERGEIEDGFENEVFTLLYFVTDPTGLRIEQAYMLLAAQLTKSDKSIYSSTKGEHDFKEISLEWNCFPARAPSVNKLANDMLQSMSILINNAEMDYTFHSNYTNEIDGGNRSGDSGTPRIGGASR